MSPDDKRHGTPAGYNAKCRDECCRAAWRKNQRSLRTRQYLARGPLVVDSIGTQRRLRALVAVGWSLLSLDAELGRKETFCSYLLSGRTKIQRSTADEVAAMYDRLSMTSPTGWRADRQRRLAAQRGWPPPLAWDNIDDPDESPTDWQYVPATRAETFAELVESQASVSEACRRLDLSPGALEKWADRAGLRPEFNAMNARERAVFEQRNQWSA